VHHPTGAPRTARRATRRSTWSFRPGPSSKAFTSRLWLVVRESDRPLIVGEAAFKCATHGTGVGDTLESALGCRSRLLGWSLGAALHHRTQLLVWRRACERVAVEPKEGQGNLAIRALADQILNYWDVLVGGTLPGRAARPARDQRPRSLGCRLAPPTHRARSSTTAVSFFSFLPPPPLHLRDSFFTTLSILTPISPPTPWFGS